MVRLGLAMAAIAASAVDTLTVEMTPSTDDDVVYDVQRTLRDCFDPLAFAPGEISAIRSQKPHMQFIESEIRSHRHTRR